MDSKRKTIDPDSIKQKLDLISFPRLSGTKKEQKAANLIIDEIKKLNLDPTIQKFSFSSFYSRVYKKIAFSLIFWLVFIIFINLTLIFTFLNIIVVIMLFIPLIIYTRKPERIRFGTEYKSKNVYLRVKSDKSKEKMNKRPILNSNPQEKLQLLFISHIDSKSQTLPIKLRVLVLKSWIYSIIVISLLLFIKLLLLDIFIINLIIIVGLGINFISTIMIIINTSGNKSNGAIDNGSGVAIMLELLKYYSNLHQRPNNIDLWFVFTGAEETGTMGIRNFSEVLENYNKENIIFLNIDSIARNLKIFGSTGLKHHKTDFFREIFESFKSLGATIILKQYISAITRSDGYYMKKQGYLGVDFGDKKSYKYIHSVNDTVDKIDPEFLSKICTTFIKFIENQ